MIVTDPIYGQQELVEPVLIELLASPAVRRLHGVLQHGITGLLGITRPISRYDHSLGVMLLVRRLGGALPEQIAALLHDVSHTVFSHVIDHLLDSAESQSYHDQMKEPYIAGTGLPAMLQGHGYDWRDFLHEERFPLLEQPAPALCADRVDYCLRDAAALGLATRAELDHILAHLARHEGRLIMDDLPAARWLAQFYLAADDASWSNFREVGLYELMARAIQRGLEVGALAQADLWGTDRDAWSRLQASPDPALQHWLALVTTGTSFVWDERQPTFRLSTKIRTIDPDVMHEGRLQPLSAWDPAFAARREAYLARKSGEWPMRVVPAGAGLTGQQQPLPWRVQ